MRSYDEQEWKRVRATGKGPFLLKHALLGRGLPMGLLTALVIELYLGGSFPDFLLELPFLGRLLFAVAVFTASGGMAAQASWSLHERRFSEKR